MKGKMQRQSDCQKMLPGSEGTTNRYGERKKMEDIRYKYRWIFSHYKAEFRHSYTLSGPLPDTLKLITHVPPCKDDFRIKTSAIFPLFTIPVYFSVLLH